MYIQNIAVFSLGFMNKTSYFFLLSPRLLGVGGRGEEGESFLRALLFLDSPGILLLDLRDPCLSSLLSMNHQKVTVVSNKINFVSPLFSASYKIALLESGGKGNHTVRANTDTQQF